MLAKGFAVDGAKTILVDIDEISLLASKSESEAGSEKRSESCRSSYVCTFLS
jgi:hypothetical protein